VSSSNSVGTLSFGIVASAKQATSTLTNFGAELKSFAKLSAGIATGTFAASATLKTLSVAGSALGSIGDFGLGSIKLAAEAEKASVAFGVLTAQAPDLKKELAGLGDSMAEFKTKMESGKKLFAELQQLAMDTPFDTAGLAQNARMLLGMGSAAKDIIPTLSRLGDVAQGDTETLGRLALQFGQVLNSGSFKKEEFNVFAEAGADVKAFAKAAGTDMAGLNKMFERGEVTSRVMVDGFNAMTNAGGRFYRMNALMSQTFDGQLNGLLESIDSFRTKIGSAFITGFKPGELFSKISDSLGGLSGLETKLVPFFEKGRKLFDGMTSSAGALASMIGGRLLGGLDALGANTSFADLEKGFKAATDGLAYGVITIVNHLSKLKTNVAEILKEFAQIGVGLAPKSDKDQQRQQANARGKGGWLVEQIVWAKHGFDDMLTPFSDSRQAVGNAAANLANVANQMADGLGKVGKELTFAEYQKERDRLLREIRKPATDQMKADRSEISRPSEQLTNKARSWLDSAEKPTSPAQEFQQKLGYYDQVKRLQPDKSSAALNLLAREYAGLQKDFFSNIEVKLPQAMEAGSTAAQDAINQAINQMSSSSDTQARIEQVLKQMRESEARQEQKLDSIRRAIEKNNFGTVRVQ
jgi:tape measure domain-containing protein